MERKKGTGQGGRQQGLSPNSASQYVRAAERYLVTGKFDLALEQLSLAQRLEPENAYILAVLERTQNLQRMAAGEHPDDRQSRRQGDSAGPRYLSVTVGKEFEHGIRELREEPVLSSQELRLRVRQLVANADALLSRGLSENAFESLMKAYLLDPLAPEVLSCEQRVLPAWEMTRNQRRQSPTGSGHSMMSEQARLDALKRQKEVQRNELERVRWREASSARGVSGGDASQAVPPSGKASKNKGTTSSKRWKLF
jgi:tetratricopeptide (TPR) repeat protein